MKIYLLGICCLLALSGLTKAEDEAVEIDGTVEEDLGKSTIGSKTDDETVEREEEAIKLDGLNVSQMKAMREAAEKHEYQAEVNRMMKLIINSLYRNKEIFLRELISNASDALDKIRFMSLTDPNVLSATSDLKVMIKPDKENHALHIIDTGIGMTRQDLVKNLGTIAKSGTSEFLAKMEEGETMSTDLIGQFGVGFYSSFLVADTVVVTSKHNDDEQYIWESDAGSFTVSKDPRGDTLGRGTQISLFMKEEAYDFLEEHTIKDLVVKYSQFINFPIHLWTSKTEKVEEPIEEDEKAEAKEGETDDDVKVEDEDDEKPKVRMVDKTVYDWEVMNDNKPIWLRAPKDVEQEDYNAFYKSFSKDTDEPLAHVHFSAEGEVTFRSILYVPKTAPYDLYQDYGKATDNIKMYVKRVFITDDFEEMMPKYLSFIKGVVDSDDLPLNVSRETLQQNKLLRVIKKKLVRKALDMLKKMSDEDYEKFYKEFGTNVKLGVMEDHSNRNRLAKLLRWQSSNSDEGLTSLTSYMERMKEKQDHIYFMTGTSRAECEKSPFVEKLLKKGYEVLYLVDPIDEYTVQNLPEFEGKKFQNAAKENLNLNESDKAKETMEILGREFDTLLNGLKDKILSSGIEKAVLSTRLVGSPCALVASQYGHSGNMERIMKSQAYAKAGGADVSVQKKILELNPFHPLVKELNTLYKADPESESAKDLANSLYDTALLRSGYSLRDTTAFSDRMDKLLRRSFNVDADAQVEIPPELDEEEETKAEDDSAKESAEEDVAADEEAAPAEDAPAEEPAAESSEAPKDEL